MSTQVVLPKLGFSVNEGTIAEWLIADGARVQQGQPLFSLESEKSIQEIESPAAGTLKIIKQAGGSFEVGTVIGEIL